MLAITNSDVRGVIFYNSNGEIMVLERDDEVAKSQKTCRLKKEQLIAFWDQAHTTGSDLSLASDMSAIVTVGRHAILRDVLQAVWRLRLLGRGQTVRLAVPKADLTLMTISDKLQLPQVIKYVWENQQTRAKDHNLRAAKQEMHTEFLMAAFDGLIDEHMPMEAVNELFKNVQSLVEQELSIIPHRIYGKRKTIASGPIY